MIKDAPAEQEAEFNESQFWFSIKLQGQDWDDVLANACSFLDNDQREVIMNSAVANNINPLILITALVMEQDSNLSLPLGNMTEFNTIVWRISDSLPVLYEDYEIADASELPASNVATSTLWKVFEEENETLEKFIVLYNQLFTQYVVYLEDRFEHTFPDDRNAYFSLNWPWPIGRSWMVLGTHSTTGRGRTHSSFDMMNQVTCDWENDRNCVSYSVPIHSMHSGVVTIARTCNVRVMHPSGYQTNYYHLDNVRVYQGQQVHAGQEIAAYSGHYQTSLCEGGRSSGPHLHTTLYYDDGFGNNREASLNGRYVGGYQITTGWSNYDTDCTHCYFYKNGKVCPFNNRDNDGYVYNDGISYFYLILMKPHLILYITIQTCPNFNASYCLSGAGYDSCSDNFNDCQRIVGYEGCQHWYFKTNCRMTCRMC